MTCNKWGGARKGAGRPPKHKEPVRLLVVMESAERRRLERVAKRLGLSLNDAVRELINTA